MEVFAASVGVGLVQHPKGVLDAGEAATNNERLFLDMTRDRHLSFGLSEFQSLLHNFGLHPASVPKDALDDGVSYIKRLVSHKHDGGGFGYQQRGSPNRARTGTGILSLELLGQHTAEQPHLPEALAGGDFLLKNPFGNGDEEYFYYTVYYTSQAANQLGGKYWDGIYPNLRKAVLARQKVDGSWPEGNGGEQSAGKAYSTAMATLSLCVPYHYLPLYQK